MNVQLCTDLPTEQPKIFRCGSPEQYTDMHTHGARTTLVNFAKVIQEERIQERSELCKIHLI